MEKYKKEIEAFTELPALSRARLSMATDEDCGGNANEVAGPENGPPEAGKGLEEAARQKWPCLVVSLFFFPRRPQAYHQMS